MPRIPLFDATNIGPAQAGVYDAIVKGPRGRLVGPLRAALHNPELAERWQQFGEILRFSTSVAKRHTELAILVVARRWSSQVEWYVHSDAALKAGLPKGVVDQLRLGQLPVFENRDDVLVYEFTRQLQQTGDVDDALYAELETQFGARGIVELSSVVGYYTLVSMTLNVHRVPLPADAIGPAPLPAMAGCKGLVDLPVADVQSKPAKFAP